MKPGARKAVRENRRGSPDAVEKRRAARMFNDILLGPGVRDGGLDGRTEKRRKRLLKELADGTARAGKRSLKPIDVLSRVQALIELGEPIASIRKACPPRKPLEATAEIIEGVRRIHRAYHFRLEAYRFVGIDDATLEQAGIAEDRSTSRNPGIARARLARGSQSARRGAA